MQKRAQFPVKNKRCKIFSDFSGLLYTSVLIYTFQKFITECRKWSKMQTLHPTFEISDRTITNFVAKFDDVGMKNTW